MRLATKLFLTSALVVLVLFATAVWSVLTVKRLVTVNRQVVTRAVPALRTESALRDAVQSLVRLETRALVLKDRQYAAAWDERAAQVVQGLAEAGRYLRSDEERAAQAQAGAALQAYRSHVAEERRLLARGRAADALGLAEGAAREAADRIEAALDAMRTGTERTLARAQGRAQTLERRTWRAVVTALAAGLALALGASAWLAVGMTRSLRRLSVAAASLAAGAWPAPLAVAGRDELSDLGHSFNRMARRLEEVERLKEEFFSHISHDLRNPLASIRLAAESVQERAQASGDTKQARFAQLIAASTQRMLTMVNQILDFTRLRARAVSLDRQPVDLLKIVARAIDELRPLAEEKRIRMNLAPGDGGLIALGDEGSLVRVIINLLGNAVAFTPPGGSIDVGLDEVGDHLELRVTDTGVGIPAEVLPQIFEPYRQAHGHRTGTGLGLAVVKGLVEAHGGTVGVRSAPGQGSSFTVTIPRPEGVG